VLYLHNAVCMLQCRLAVNGVCGLSGRSVVLSVVVDTSPGPGHVFQRNVHPAMTNSGQLVTHSRVKVSRHLYKSLPELKGKGEGHLI